MKKKLLVIVLMLLGMPFCFVDADEVCSEKYMADLKARVNTISVNQTYIGNKNFDGNYQWYELTFDFQGLENDVFIAASLNGQRISNGTERLYLESGERSLGVYSTHCAEYRIGYVDVNLPKFNEMALEDSCSSIYGNYYLEECDPWNQNDVSYTDLMRAVDKYNEEMNKEEVNFFEEYRLFIIGGIGVLLLLIILLLVRRHKRNRLD